MHGIIGGALIVMWRLVFINLQKRLNLSPVAAGFAATATVTFIMVLPNWEVIKDWYRDWRKDSANPAPKKGGRNLRHAKPKYRAPGRVAMQFPDAHFDLTSLFKYI